MHLLMLLFTSLYFSDPSRSNRFFFFSLSILSFCRTDQEFLQWPSFIFSSDDLCHRSHRLFQSLLCWRWWSLNPGVKVNGQKLETVTSFKYLGSVITDEGSKPEILSRIAQTTAALRRMKPVWNDRSIFLSSKIRLMRSLVTSIFLYACESWTLTVELQRRIQAIEMRCYRKILRVSHYQRGSPCQDPAGNRTTRKTPDDRKETQTAVVWSCLPFIRSGQNHLARHSERGKKTRQTEEEVGRQHQRMDRPEVRQITESSEEQKKWRKLVVKSSVVPTRPTRLRDRWVKMTLTVYTSSRLLRSCPAQLLSAPMVNLKTAGEWSLSALNLR